MIINWILSHILQASYESSSVCLLMFFNFLFLFDRCLLIGFQVSLVIAIVDTFFPECGFSFHFLCVIVWWTKILNFNKVKCISLLLFMFWSFCLSFCSVLYHTSCTVRQETEMKDMNIGKKKANCCCLQLVGLYRKIQKYVKVIKINEFSRKSRYNLCAWKSTAFYIPATTVRNITGR